MMLTPSLSMVMTLPPAVGLVARAPPLPAPTDVVTPAAATAGSGHDLLLGGRTAAGSAAGARRCLRHWRRKQTGLADRRAITRARSLGQRTTNVCT